MKLSRNIPVRVCIFICAKYFPKKMFTVGNIYFVSLFGSDTGKIFSLPFPLHELVGRDNCQPRRLVVTNWSPIDQSQGGLAIISQSMGIICPSQGAVSCHQSIGCCRSSRAFVDHWSWLAEWSGRSMVVVS